MRDGQLYQMRVLGTDANGEWVALAFEIPEIKSTVQIRNLKTEGRKMFLRRYPNGKITSIRRVAMGPREEHTS